MLYDVIVNQNCMYPYRRWHYITCSRLYVYICKDSDMISRDHGCMYLYRRWQYITRSKIVVKKIPTLWNARCWTVTLSRRPRRRHWMLSMQRLSFPGDRQRTMLNCVSQGIFQGIFVTAHNVKMHGERGSASLNGGLGVIWGLQCKFFKDCSNLFWIQHLEIWLCSLSMPPNTVASQIFRSNAAKTQKRKKITIQLKEMSQI